MRRPWRRRRCVDRCGEAERCLASTGASVARSGRTPTQWGKSLIGDECVSLTTLTGPRCGRQSHVLLRPHRADLRHAAHWVLAGGFFDSDIGHGQGGLGLSEQAVECRAKAVARNVDVAR